MKDQDKSKEQLIDELKTLRQQLDDSEKQLKKNKDTSIEQLANFKYFYNISPVGMCLLSPDLRYIHINETLAKINGKPVLEHIGKTLKEVIPEIAEDIEPIYKQVRDTGKPIFNYEVHGTTSASQEKKDWVVSYYPVYTENESLLGVGTIVQDITEQIQNRERLKQSESHFREMADSMPQLTWTCLPDGPCDYLSQQWIDYTGIPEEPQLGYGWLEQLHPDDRERTIREWKNKVVDGTDFEIQFRIRNANGDYHQFLTRAVPMRNSEGTIVKWLGSNTNINKQKLIEEELRLNKEMLDQMTEGVYLITAEDGILRYVNPAFRNFFGYEEDEIIGQHVSICNAPTHLNPKEIAQLIVKEINETGKYSGEMENIHKDGHRFWSSIKVKKVTNETYGVCWVCVCHDITKRREMEKKLIEAKELADAANQAKTKFLANMSHEIRTPLGAITGFVEILSHQVKTQNISKSFLEPLQKIKVASDNLTSIINNVLDLTKIEADKIEFEEEIVNINELVQNICTIHQSKIKQQKIYLSYTIDPEIPELIISDPTMITQIMTNLVGNAVKFTSEGKKIQINVLKKDQAILFQVADQGIGIPKNKQKCIFETFEQVDGSITRKYGGTGLGLAITKKLVHLLNGSIAVESTVGEGSIFSVIIPFKESDVSVETKENLFENCTFSKNVLVLLVEDNMINQGMFQTIFEDFGISLEIASNGKEGIEKALEIEPDLIFMDIHMPVMGGVEAIRRLRSKDKFKAIPIVIITADVLIQQKEEAMKVGASDYLTKPIDFEALLRLLKKYLS